MTHAPFLFEIGCEEVPARFVDNFLDELCLLLRKSLDDLRIDYDDIQATATYRRFCLYVSNMALNQHDFTETIKGPPVDIAYDSNNELTKAGLGFLKKCKIDASQLSTCVIQNKKYIAFEKEEKGQISIEILSNELPKICQRVSLPIAMKWGSGQDVFIRPVHWIVCLLGDRIVPFSLFNCQSSDITYGHRFLSSGEDLKGGSYRLSSPSDYADILKNKGSVIVSIDERRQIIKSELLKHKATLDEDLLNEVVHLVEYPVVLTGYFDERFLSLPDEVLIECMKKHQKYFSVLDDKNQLSNQFVVVADSVTEKNKSSIIKGNERVLSARLEDALFFWEEDKQKPLEFFVDKLKGVVFHKKCGTLYDKQARIAFILNLFKELQLTTISVDDLKRVSLLSKADLVTQMVFEFPSLQGVMGGYYAQTSKESSMISTAISEHYMPLGAGANCPSSELGKLLALADRMDTMVSLFSVGIIPTGSQDPFGLRRAGNSVCSLMMSLDIPFPIFSVFERVLCEFKPDSDVQSEWVQFMNQRLKTYLIDAGLRYDIAESVIHIASVDLKKAHQVGMLLMTAQNASLDSFKAIVDTAVRVKRLSKKLTQESFSESLFKIPIEKEVYDVYQTITKESLSQSIDSLKLLTHPLTTYFDDVLVMDKDKTIQNNRLTFLKYLDDIYMEVADFEKIVIDS